MTLPGPNRTHSTARRARSLPSDRLNMARSLLTPRLLAEGHVDEKMFNEGCADALAGKPWRLTPADLLAAGVGPLSYMLGYRAGQLEDR